MTKTSNQFDWHVGKPEFFNLMGHQWDVREAKKIVKEKALEVHTIDVDVWCKFLRPYASDLVETDGKGRRIIHMGVSVEWAVAKDSDLSLPLIVVQLEIKKESSPVIIDGYHRLFRAQREGVKTLSAVLLGKKDSEKVKL